MYSTAQQYNINSLKRIGFCVRCKTLYTVFFLNIKNTILKIFLWLIPSPKLIKTDALFLQYIQRGPDPLSLSKNH